MENESGVLAKISAQLEAISVSIDEVKKNLLLGEGTSTLRDSVKVLIGKEMAEQRKSCINGMHDSATSIARAEVASHVKDYHSKRDSKNPDARITINGAMLKKIGLILGGTAIGGSGIWSIIKQFIDSLQ